MNLKPCPLCGGEAERNAYGYDDIDGIYRFIQCKKCGLELPRAEQYTSWEEVDEAWNTRAERTCRIITTRADSDYVNDWRYRCSECLCNIPVNERIQATGEIISAANYCPNCGAKVVD